MEDNNSKLIYSVVITLLLLLSGGIGWFFWNKTQKLVAENKERVMMVDSLTNLKANLEKSLDSLQTDYTALRTENENLLGKIAAATNLVSQKEGVIRQIKETSAGDLAALQAQVEELKKVKTEYETVINLLKTENGQLKEENLALKGENASLKGDKESLSEQVSDLAKKLEDQIRKTQSAAFRATSFRVELEKRRDRLTTMARKVREINVSFDLADVPENFRGPAKLYLVITDDTGTPIPSDNPIKSTIYAPTGPVDIMAQQTRAVVLDQTQRYTFTYPVEERLKKGNFVIAIYCEKGLLGVASFKLV